MKENDLNAGSDNENGNANINSETSNGMETKKVKTEVENNQNEVEPLNSSNEMNMENEVVYKTVKAVINGEEQEIILGYSIYNMERPKDKGDLLSLLDKTKLLKVIFHMTNAEIFWNENIELKDANGNMIPKDTPNVYVSCDTPDSHWRYTVDEILQNVEVHNFASIQEYGQTIGNSTLYSRKPNNVEALGFAAIASKNQTYSSIYNFAKEHKIPMNTAMLFFNVKLNQVHTMQLAMGLNVKDIPELKRTVEEAESLIEAVTYTFGDKEKGKRYAINSINAVINKLGFDIVIEALAKIPASTITIYKMSDCHGKEGCLIAELVFFIKEMRLQNAA